MYPEVAGGLQRAFTPVQPLRPRAQPSRVSGHDRHWCNAAFHRPSPLTPSLRLAPPHHARNLRVQFSRNELMTEVILDTEVMPREPHDCLPAHMTVVPALLNGRCQDAMARLGPRAVAAAAASRPFGVMPLTGSWVTGLDAQLVGGGGCLWHRWSEAHRLFRIHRCMPAYPVSPA